jgi:hypothetical protein
MAKSGGVKIISDFPSQVDKDLLTQICRWHRSKDVYVRLFPRFGFSGSKLLLVFFYPEPKGLPYLIKIGKIESMKEEFKAVESMKDLVSDCKLEESHLFESGDFGALIYRHKGAIRPTNAENPTTLRELIYDFSGKVNDEKLALIIEEVYDSLEQAHLDSEIRDIDVDSFYGRYYRGNTSDIVLKNIFGISRDKNQFEYLGVNIYNPIKYRYELPSKINGIIGRIHGDLHPDNIVLDSKYKIGLIDFAWAFEPRDVLVDFVLFENSIRFMHFPKAVNVYEQAFVDERLLEENGADDIISHDFSSEDSNRLYHRMARIIKKTRGCAKELFGGGFCFEKYLFSQFIVLYGLLRYDTYNQMMAARVLGMIADKIKKIKFDHVQV